jgi:NifU-like protein involved in Fe-S cluster formation
VAIAAASCLLDLAVGRTVDECAQLTAADISAALDGVPEDKAWCVDLALAALRAGLNLQNAVENRRADFSKDS